MATTASRQTRPPLWRNSTFLKWAAQILVLGGVAAFGYLMISQASTNLGRLGLDFIFLELGVCQWHWT